jgi:hypothetical protein
VTDTVAIQRTLREKPGAGNSPKTKKTGETNRKEQQYFLNRRERRPAPIANNEELNALDSRVIDSSVKGGNASRPSISDSVVFVGRPKNGNERVYVQHVFHGKKLRRPPR